jgi:hypothetical protein
MFWIQETAATDLAPFAGTVGGGFFIGLVTGYAIKKVIKLAALIVGLFIAALAYLEYQRRGLGKGSRIFIKWNYLGCGCINACFKYYRHDSFRNINKCWNSPSV